MRHSWCLLALHMSMLHPAWRCGCCTLSGRSEPYSGASAERMQHMRSRCLRLRSRSLHRQHCVQRCSSESQLSRVPGVQITIGGARIRVKLDEHRIEELLKGSDSSAAASSAAARVLSCLGDMGQVSFMPHNGGALLTYWAERLCKS